MCAVLLLLSARPVLATAAPEGLPKTTVAFDQLLGGADSDVYFDVLVVARREGVPGSLTVLDRPVRAMAHLPITRVLLNAAEVRAVLRDDAVAFVEPNQPLALNNTEATALTGVDAVRPQGRIAGAAGYTGAGVHVAVIDSGVDATHPDLREQIERAWVGAGASPEVYPAVNGDPTQHVDRSGADLRVYVSSGPDGIDVDAGFKNALQRIDVDGPTAAVTDWYGHGTHVTGIIAGDGADGGQDRGVAPGVRVHSYTVGLSAPVAGVPLSFVVEAYDHIISQVRAGVPIRIANFSVGAPGCDMNEKTWPLRPNQVAQYEAFLAGVLTVHSYGNSGAPQPPDPQNKCTATVQSMQPYLMSVGSTDKGRTLSTFSSQGAAAGNQSRATAMANFAAFYSASPSEQAAWDIKNRPLGLFRPGVTAPGEAISSTLAAFHGRASPAVVTEPSAKYGMLSGTSMAAPHVAGVAALAAEAYHRHRGHYPSPTGLIQLLESTADHDAMLTVASHEGGAGFVDAAAAVTAAPGAGSRLSDTALAQPVDLAVSSSGRADGVVGPASSWAPTTAGTAVVPIVVAKTTRHLRATVSASTPAPPGPGHPAGAHVSLYAPGVDVATGRPASSTRSALLPALKKPGAWVSDPVPGVWHLRIDAYAGALYGADWQQLR